MTIRESIIDVASISKNYKVFIDNVRTRLGSAIDLVRSETIDSLWAKELQKRNEGIAINKYSGN